MFSDKMFASKTGEDNGREDEDRIQRGEEGRQAQIHASSSWIRKGWGPKIGKTPVVGILEHDELDDIECNEHDEEADKIITKKIRAGGIT